METTAASRKLNDAYESASEASKMAREKLISGMKTVIDDAEYWLKNAGAEGDADILAVKQKLEATLHGAKTDLLKLEMNMLERTRLAAMASCLYIKENPWKAASVGALIGALAGWLAMKK